MYTIDPLYILLSVPAILLAISAQIAVRYLFSKYSQVPNTKNINGIDIVEMVVRRYGFDIKLLISPFNLTDNYNPFNSQLTLSERVARTPSIASVGIVAHELGHVLQHKKGAYLLTIRNFLIPVVNIGTTIAYLLFMIGFALQLFGLVILGVVIFSLSTLFTVVTLPIEIDASSKAMAMIRDLNLLDRSEEGDAKKVLFAASLTYVAAVFQSLTSLFYYILRALGMRRRR